MDTGPRRARLGGWLVDVAAVAAVFAHLLEVAGGVLDAHGAVLRDDVDKGLVDVLGHAGGVAADVEVGAGVDPLPYVLAVLAHAVLDVDLLRLVAGEG